MAKKKLTIEDVLVPKDEIPYEVPENWCWVKLGSLVELERGITFPASAKRNDMEDGLIACLRTANVQTNLEIDNLIYVDRSYMKSNEKKLVREGDIIMSTANSLELVGKLSIVENINQEMTFGGFVLNIRNKGYILNKYLFYYLRGMFLFGEFQKLASQTTNIANINAKKLEEIKMAIPPLAEQERIVNRIESLFEKVDKASELVEEAREGFEKRRAAILEKAFSGELTKNWREKHGISFEWRNYTLGDIIKEGPQNGLYKPKSAYGEGNLIVRIDNFYDGTINPWDTLKRLQLTDKDIGLYSLENGDFLVNRVNSIDYLGKSALVRGLNETSVFESNIMRFKINDDINKEYIIKYMNSPIGLRELRKNAKHAVNQASINQQDVKSASIILPSIEEQNEIVRILDLLIDSDREAYDLSKINNDVDIIKKSILAKAFRGELGSNDLEEESSTTLLKEIIQ